MAQALAFPKQNKSATFELLSCPDSSYEDITKTLRRRQSELERELDKLGKTLKVTIAGMEQKEKELAKVNKLLSNL